MDSGLKLTINTITIAFGVASVAARAWVGLCLWRWFAVPMGAKDANYATILGLLLLARVFTGINTRHQEDTRTEEKKTTDQLVTAIVVLLLWFIILAVGSVLRGMVPA